MVADHQGGWHQGGMIQPGSFHNLSFREIWTHLRHQRAIFAVMHSDVLEQRRANVRPKPEEGRP